MKAQFLNPGVGIPFSEYEYIHNGRPSPTTAYEINERARFRLTVPRTLGVRRADIEIFSESGEYLTAVPLEWVRLSGAKEFYEAKLPIRSLSLGLYFFRPKVTVFSGMLYGKRRGKKVFFDTSTEPTELFQLTVSEFRHKPYDEIFGGVIYHIFVDRFRRGGRVEIPDTARMVEGEWTSIPEFPEYPGAPLKNNTFYGGTLYGIIEKLDYISSLGVRLIYLSPIFKSVSNHKYDTADYMQVDSMFGGEGALSKLICECKKRRIGIILDGVFNHTGDDSVYFNRYGRFSVLGAYQSKNSKYYPWYDFKNFPDRYTSWWDIEILPRINPDIPECNDFFVGSGGVIQKYADMGISGFRLDVADELSDSFIERIKDRLSEKRPSLLYGEVWEDASNKIAYSKRKRYYLGTELDGVMNYPLRKGIIEYILNKDTRALEYAIEVMHNAPERIMHLQMNLLGTHDTERILTVLGGKPVGGRTNAELSTDRMTDSERRLAVSRLISAYTVLATLPGIPTVFYGDEAGLEGYGDPFNRMPYPWGRECGELVSHYQKIGKIRAENEVYKTGKFKLYVLTCGLLIFSRSFERQEYFTVMNNSDCDTEIFFSRRTIDLMTEKNSKRHTVSRHTATIFKTLKNTKLQAL